MYMLKWTEFSFTNFAWNLELTDNTTTAVSFIFFEQMEIKNSFSNIETPKK